MVSIRAVSRAEIEAASFERPVAVVSVRSAGGPLARIPTSPLVMGVLRLEFDDVDDPAAGSVMTDGQAREILSFARTHLAAGAEIVCQCEAGVSRSAGIAAALFHIHVGHHGGFHRTHRPNPWVRRVLLRVARAPSSVGAGAEGGSTAPASPSLPTALPAAVLVRHGRTCSWVPRSTRRYPAGTLGGDRRTLAAHVYVPLAREGSGAREVGVWARGWLRRRHGTTDALVLTRAGAWRAQDDAGALHPEGEPAVEIYVQTDRSLTRDAWTGTLRELADALADRFHPPTFDVVLVEDGLMYKRAVWESREEAG